MPTSSTASQQAARIYIGTRAMQLPVKSVPQEIALLHDGTIRILAGSWQGARIRMELPVRSVAAGGGKIRPTYDRGRSR